MVELNPKYVGEISTATGIQQGLVTNLCRVKASLVNRVRYGRGLAGFLSPGHTVTMDRGGYFEGDPPSRASPRLFPGRGPVSLYLF